MPKKTRTVKSYGTAKKSGRIKKDRRALVTVLEKTSQLPSKGFDCIVIIRDGDKLHMEGTKSWVQGFNSDQFLESLGGAQVEDGVESEDEGDPDLLVLTLDQKRKMLSTLINRSKDKGIWGFSPPYWWPGKYPFASPKQQIGEFKHDVKTITDCLESYYQWKGAGNDCDAAKVEEKQKTAVKSEKEKDTAANSEERQVAMINGEAEKKPYYSTLKYTSGGEWFKLNEESARTIDDNNWLDGDIIDFILRLVSKSHLAKKWKLLSTVVAQIGLEQMDNYPHEIPRVLEDGCEGAILPLHVNGNHWLLAIFITDVIFIMDSRKSSSRPTYEDRLLKLHSRMFGRNSVVVELKNLEVPQQSNDYDCGVFTVAFGEWALMHKKNNMTQSMVEVKKCSREHMKYLLIRYARGNR